MQTSGKQSENAFHIQKCFLLCNRRLIWHCDSFKTANILAPEKNGINSVVKFCYYKDTW